jgi:hypothetical protein
MRFWRRAASSPGPDPSSDPSPGPDPSPGSDPSPDPVRAELLAWAQAVDVSRLSDKTAKQAETYLRDYRRMNVSARREWGFRVRDAIATQVRPPPPVTIPPLDVMATVIAARRKQLGTG